jgi:hypothetical protein
LVGRGGWLPLAVGGWLPGWAREGKKEREGERERERGGGEGQGREWKGDKELRQHRTNWVHRCLDIHL